MHARMTTLEASPDRLDAMAQQFEAEIVPLLRDLDGFDGYMLMGDQESGRAIAVTFWSSEDALRRSEEAVMSARQAAAETAGATTPPQVDRFAVLAHQLQTHELH